MPDLPDPKFRRFVPPPQPRVETPETAARRAYTRAGLALSEYVRKTAVLEGTLAAYQWSPPQPKGAPADDRFHHIVPAKRVDTLVELELLETRGHPAAWVFSSSKWMTPRQQRQLAGLLEHERQHGPHPVMENLAPTLAVDKLEDSHSLITEEYGRVAAEAFEIPIWDRSRRVDDSKLRAQLSAAIQEYDQSRNALLLSGRAQVVDRVLSNAPVFPRTAGEMPFRDAWALVKASVDARTFRLFEQAAPSLRGLVELALMYGGHVAPPRAEQWLVTSSERFIEVRETLRTLLPIIETWPGWASRPQLLQAPPVAPARIAKRRR